MTDIPKKIVKAVLLIALLMAYVTFVALIAVVIYVSFQESVIAAFVSVGLGVPCILLVTAHLIEALWGEK